MTLLDKNRQRPSVIFMGKDRRFLARCPRCETTVDVRSQHKNFEPLYVESQQGSEFKHRGPTPRRITVRNSVKQFPATTLIFRPENYRCNIWNSHLNQASSFLENKFVRVFSVNKILSINSFCSDFNYYNYYYGTPQNKRYIKWQVDALIEKKFI